MRGDPAPFVRALARIRSHAIRHAKMQRARARALAESAASCAPVPVVVESRTRFVEDVEQADDPRFPRRRSA